MRKRCIVVLHDEQHKQEEYDPRTDWIARQKRSAISSRSIIRAHNLHTQRSSPYNKLTGEMAS